MMGFDGDAFDEDEPMTDRQRSRVIDDLSQWKVEYEEFDFSDEELNRWRAYLADMDDEELQDTWRGCVGEWLCTRSDLSHDPDAETFVEQQLEKVIAGDDTEYGFVVAV